MSLSDLLSEKDILEINPEDKWFIIEHLVGVMVQREKISAEHATSILDALVEREKSMSTGIGDGVALPHCSSIYVDKPHVVMAICRNGLEFDSIDKLPVHFIILLIIPKNKFQVHLNTLAEIARTMNNPAFREQLLQFNTIKEMYEFISQQK